MKTDFFRLIFKKFIILSCAFSSVSYATDRESSQPQSKEALLTKSEYRAELKLQQSRIEFLSSIIGNYLKSNPIIEINKYSLLKPTEKITLISLLSSTPSEVMLSKEYFNKLYESYRNGEGSNSSFIEEVQTEIVTRILNQLEKQNMFNGRSLTKAGKEAMITVELAMAFDSIYYPKARLKASQSLAHSAEVLSLGGVHRPLNGVIDAKEVLASYGAKQEIEKQSELEGFVARNYNKWMRSMSLIFKSKTKGLGCQGLFKL